MDDGCFRIHYPKPRNNHRRKLPISTNARN
ncbi:hypothetical protein Gotur_023881, partial [Gossypium turneri]